jgi:putative peptidoglycan lipid II flippase
VPTMVYDLVVGGAVSAALIPVFSTYAAAGDQAGLRRVAGTILTLTFLILALTVAVLWLFAEQMMGVLGMGFAPEYRSLAVDLVRLALPAVLFLGLSGIFTALLYARQIFVYSAFSVAAYNAGIIVAALLLAARFGPLSLVVGVLLGAFFQVALQLPGLRGLGLRPVLDLRHPGVRRVLLLYAPVALGLVISQVGVVIDRNLASRAGEGAMTAMRLATTLVQLPLGLVVTAAAYAVLPSLSRFAAALLPEAEGDDAAKAEAAEAYRTTLLLGLRFSLFFILPAMVGLVALREPLIGILFQRGAFGAEDTAQTAWILLFYLPQLPFVAADQLLIFAFYARKNTLTPMLVGLLGVGVYLAAGTALLEPLGAAGLALANTLQHTVHALVLFVLLARAVGGLAGRRLWLPLAKLGLAAALAGLALLALTGPLAGALGLDTAAGQLVYLGAATAVGGAVYLLAVLALRAEELTLARGLLGRALRARLRRA